MPLARATKIIAALLIGLFLSVPHAALAQELFEANDLNRLDNAGRYSEAEPLYKQSLAIRQKVLGPNHSEVAASLNSLVLLYGKQGRHSEAIPLAWLALTIDEEALGPDRPEVATLVNNLAELYRAQGRYANAELLCKRSLAIREKVLGPDHLDVAMSLNNLAGLYENEGRYADAEPLYKRALAINEKGLGSDHPVVALNLSNLAALYFDQGRYSEAEPLLQRALAVREKALGPDHPDVAVALNDLALLYERQGRYADAEPLYKRALAINEKGLGPDHPVVATYLNNLAELYRAQGRYADAEPLLQRALAVREKALGPDHPDVALLINNLGLLYLRQGRYADAEPLYKRSLAIGDKVLGPNHPAVATYLGDLAALYSDQGRYSEAEPLLQRALAVKENALGPDHPDVAVALNNLALLYERQRRYADAEPLYKRALAINEKGLGPDHSVVAIDVNNLASLYGDQGRYADAESLYKRSLSVSEKALGPDHPDVALNNLAVLYGRQARNSEAELLYKRSQAIWEKTLGPDHPNTALSLNNLAELYRLQGRYADALPFVKRTISQNSANKDTALAVLYGSENQKIITSKEALNASYTVLQRSASSAAGEAISKLASRFAAGTNELAQYVRKDQDLAAEADRLDKSIIAAVSKPAAERNQTMEDQIRKRIGEIKLQRGNLQDVFNQRYPDYVALSKPQPLAIEETQALLADDEAVVTIDLDRKSYVWVITKDRAEWKELSVSAEDVSKAVRILRTGLDTPKPFDSNLAYELYRKVLGPIEEIISNKTRLSFVLDGALTSLPPQVLITTDPDGKNLNSVDWLVRKYAVTVLPSIASLKILRHEKSTVAALKPMIGFGDPVFDRTAEVAGRQKVAGLNRSLTSFYRGVTADTRSLAEALPALPETADELRAIAKILGATSEDIKLGEAASVTDIKHERLGNYRVVYFATHALVAGEVEKFAKVKAEPALVLSIPEKPTEDDDGLLRASDVAMLKMNADFVVLSACNTAAGDKPGAEALSGLARAFFYAGAKSLVVSHWEVDSDATVELMDGLFEALKANPRLSHAEALQASMLRMIANSSKPEWAQPQFWAPFVVVGEPQKY
jgi:tetratricopeptide (TPR) repeat protein